MKADKQVYRPWRWRGGRFGWTAWDDRAKWMIGADKRGELRTRWRRVLFGLYIKIGLGLLGGCKPVCESSVRLVNETQDYAPVECAPGARLSVHKGPCDKLIVICACGPFDIEGGEPDGGGDGS